MTFSRIGAPGRGPRRRSGGAGAVERGTRPVRDRPPRGCPCRCRLSKSATKTRIEPEHRKRIVDIPRFHSRPISPRGAFVADLDTPPPWVVPGVPPAPLGRSQNNLPATPLSLYYAPLPSTEPFSPEPATQGRGSARRCGKDGHGVGVARMGAAPPCTASDLPAPSRRSWPVRESSW